MTAFARVTEAHDLECLGVCPCAQQLYRWLLRLRPAGTPLEVFLEYFSEWSARGRERPYSIKQIKRSLNQLIEVGLVEELRKFGARAFKLVAYHPGQRADQTKPSNTETEESENKTELSKIEPSNTDSSIGSYRDIESHSTPTTHPVVALEENNSDEITTGNSLQVGEGEGYSKAQGFEVEEIPRLTISIEEEKLLVEARAAISPKTLHQGLRQRVLEAGTEAARAAISAVQEQVARGGVINPAGLLVTALRQGWEPAERPYTGDEVSEELREWYPRAVAAGFVEDVPLRYLPTIMGERQVRVPRPGQTPPYELVGWREMRARME